MFVAKVIKFNEFSKQINLQDGAKSVRTNAVLFDMTFLMLCFITQKYGYQVNKELKENNKIVIKNKINFYYKAIFPDGGNDTFFEKWCRQCMVELGNPKSHETMMGECDPSKVEALLTAIDNGEDIINWFVIIFRFMKMKCSYLNYILYSDTSWDQICVSIIGATHDVLVAWENSTLSSNDVKRILDSMRSSMFCLPICAAAWLCSYMQVFT